MSVAHKLFVWFWWGPLRRLFEPIARRLLGQSQHIVTGPLQGAQFRGGLAQVLGVYEPQVQEAIVSHLSEGNIFYDVGAFNGFFSLLAARRVGKGGFVYAFEPFPGNAARVRNAFAENAIANYEVIGKALSHTSERAHLFFDGDDSSPTPSLHQGQSEDTIEIQCTTLQDFVRDNPWPDFIKVDVEGAEVEVLRGAEQLLMSDRAPTWLIEVHGADTERDTVEQLRQAGYRTCTLHSPREERTYPRHLLAHKP